MAVGTFKLPLGGDTPVDPSGWIRPADWLAMPSIGTQEFIGLLAITDDESNHIALACAGAYTVDWGDGTSQNVATGVKAEKSYTYSAISNSTISSRGYKQVLVRVTPQAGQNLTAVNLQQQNSILAKSHVTGWLDIEINGLNITTLTLGGVIVVRHGMCERVTIGSIGAITNFTNLFSNFYSLQSVNLFNTASGTNFTTMFEGCFMLKSIPLINTSSGITFTSMFNSCFSLETIPLINTGLGTNFTNMFISCYGLKSVPLINTSSGTNFTNMFTNCTALQFVPLFVTTSGTNFTSMFQSCFSIQYFPLFNTSAGTNFTNMFNSCLSLQLLPNFNTAAGTVFTGMITGNISLAKGAFQGTRYSITYNAMCLSQSAIVDIFNGLGTAVGTPTITVSNNPGYAGLTVGERLIATTKGFTIA